MNTGKTLNYGYAYMYTCLRRKGLRLEHRSHRAVMSRATRRSYSYKECTWDMALEGGLARGQYDTFPDLHAEHSDRV